MQTLHTLRIDHDTKNQLVWFSGSLSDGHQFAIGFPIAHIQVTFDDHAASMGWCGQPLCGSVPEIQGFFSTVNAGSRSGGPAARIFQQAHAATMRNVAQQAVQYGKAGAQYVKNQRALAGPRASHALPAVGAHGLAAMHAAFIAVKNAASGTGTADLKNRVRSMVANPSDPIARITIAALQSQRV